MWSSITVLIALLVLLAVAFFPPYRTRPYAAYAADGLWDLYVGTVLLALALADRFQLDVVAFVPILLYPVLLAAKRAVTAPRLSEAELRRTGAAMRVGDRRPLVYLAAGLALPLVLLLAVRLLALLPGFLPTAPSLGSWLSLYLPALLWLVAAVVLAAWGYRSGTPRLMVYAGALALIVLAAWLTELPFYMASLLLGVIVTLGGLSVLSRFVHTHPTHGHTGGI